MTNEPRLAIVNREPLSEDAIVALASLILDVVESESCVPDMALVAEPTSEAEGI